MKSRIGLVVILLFLLLILSAAAAPGHCTSIHFATVGDTTYYQTECVGGAKP